MDTTTVKTYAESLRKQAGSHDAAKRLLMEQTKERYLFSGAMLGECIWHAIETTEQLVCLDDQLALKELVMGKRQDPLKGIDPNDLIDLGIGR